MSRSIAGAVFDMDGLLLDTETLSRDAYHATREWAGLPPDQGFFLTLIGLNSRDGDALLVSELSGLTDFAAFRAAWREALATRLAAGIPLKGHARDVLESLSARGIPLAVATSTRTEIAHEHLSRAGLRRYFQVLVGGDQVENGKPAPDIYLKATALLGLASAQCAAFEDSANGVRAAVAAGLLTVQVPDLVHPTPELLALGHMIAPDLAAAVGLAGLLPQAELIPSL